MLVIEACAVEELRRHSAALKWFVRVARTVLGLFHTEATIAEEVVVGLGVTLLLLSTSDWGRQADG
jgi:hypothetical protein